MPYASAYSILWLSFGEQAIKIGMGLTLVKGINDRLPA